MSEKNSNKMLSQSFSLGSIGSVTFIIKSAGQSHPSVSDDVEVSVSLYLPCSYHNRQLHEELRFGKRVQVADKDLDADWGQFGDDYRKQCCRRVRRRFSAPTWYEAVELAKSYALYHTQVLLDAVVRRQARLETAGEFPKHL